MAKILRFIGRLIKGLGLTTIALASLIFIALVIFSLHYCSKIKNDKLTFGIDNSIDCTPTIVEQMRAIGQWEFLSISDEELIDTVRRGFFGDDELVRIYYGTLHLGIDFRDCSKDWISNEKDTIYITIPEIRLLDNNFIDEARTRSFFETGKWSNKDRKDMYDRAQQRMLKRCMTDTNIAIAKQNAHEQIAKMLQPIAKPKGIVIK